MIYERKQLQENVKYPILDDLHSKKCVIYFLFSAFH